MKKLTLLLCILLSNMLLSQDCEYLSLDKKFEKGDTVTLFGDNVRLRLGPTSESETLQLLKIGTRLTVIDESQQTTFLRGVQSNWYKVSYNNEEGFVLGSLISLVDLEQENTRCFIQVQKENDQWYILTRVLSKMNTTDYFENKSSFLGSNYGFCVKLFDNKGVQQITNIIAVNYIPESCGANSGGFYLFFDKKNLTKVMDLASSADIGFWESEQLLFPNDKGGERNKILFVKEDGEYPEDMDESENSVQWEKSSKITIKLEWQNHQLKPDPRIIVNEKFSN